MSLQIWLPLNGSLENKGLMDIQANNIDSTIDSKGKIGSCYSFNGTTSRIYANNVNIETNDLSACFWFKIDEYKTSTYLTLFALATAAASKHQIGAYLDKTTSKLIVTHNGSGLNTNFVPELNIWYHFAFTNLGTTSKCYINGEEIYSGTNSGTQCFSSCLCLCGRASSTSGGGSGVTYLFTGAMNDFRLYDHCLSTKEVKEISKGLILHYKLDDVYAQQDGMIYDSSGYENNGEVVNTLEFNTDTPRYSYSTGSSNVTPVNISTMFDSTKLSSEFTLSTWVYNASDLRDANRYFYNGIIRMGFSTSYWVILSWIHCNADLSYNRGNSWSPVGEAYSYTKDEWCHIAVTFKDGVLKYYRNGSRVTTDDRSDTGQFIRGQFNSDAKLLHNWDGRLSDFRLYCTALSDDDIKELYDTSVSIDNKGNMYARELIEE